MICSCIYHGYRTVREPNSRPNAVFDLIMIYGDDELVLAVAVTNGRYNVYIKQEIVDRVTRNMLIGCN